VIRTHRAGTLSSADEGAEITLAGWVDRRRDHGGVAFLDLRDASGVVQVVVNDPDVAHGLRDEYCLRIVGTVRRRPEGNENPDIPTGSLEVEASEVEVLSPAAPLPFPVDDRATIGEEARLRYRYLDLRRPSVGDNLRMRSKLNQICRDTLLARDFVEIETPTLTASTPEGARDFLVPARLQPGNWYALPQSPQLFKQLLMVAGMERYFQIARCYRDEDFRGDRQPEFTQLDIEMSFVEQEDVIQVGEAIVRALWQGILGVDIGAVPRMPYAEAMRRYGTDKPDLRFGLELVDVTATFAGTAFKAFASAATIRAMRVPAATHPVQAAAGRAALDRLTDRAKQLGAKGLVWLKVGEGGALESPVAKFLSDAERAALVAATGAVAGDLLLLVADEWSTACTVLGQLRNDLARPPVHEGPYAYVWVTEFPLFVGVNAATGRPQPGHHPFCHPHPDDLERLETDPLGVRALAYDLVLNGWELGSGSIRIHEPELQRRVFRHLGISDEEADRRFGFFLHPFRYGAPPHGGFAFGIDRLVAILAGEDNIREVIAFPKTQSGTDPMTDAPTPVGDAQLAELGIRLLPPPTA